ncbi:MAG: histidine kinase [Thermoleophilaceae bacterium]
MRRGSVLLMLPVVAVAALTVAVARRQPEWALAGSPGALALEVSAGLVLAVAGLVIHARGPDARSGALLYASAVAWLVAEWNTPGALGAVVFTLGMVFAYAAPALAAHALLVHGTGHLGSLAARVAVAAGYVGLAGVAGIAATAAREPSEAGCSTCPANLVAVTNAPEAARWLERWGLRIGIAALAAVVLLSAWRAWRASPAARRTVVPVLVPAVAFLAIVAAQLLHDLARGWEGFDQADESLRLAEGLALTAVALGVMWQRFAARRMRHRLAGLVVDLADAVRPGELRGLMAAALDDPTLDLVFAFDDGWVDADGVPRALPASGERGQTSLVQDGEVVALVIHTPGLLDDARLVDELSRAARLAIDHDRLQAQQRTQLARLRATRTATVANTDAERRRLERDLHDGAQQALAALAMTIGLARGARSDAQATRMALAQAHVRAALDRVRAIAHAAYPAALDEAGLAAALDVLGDWRPQVELLGVPEARLDHELETSVYFIVAALSRGSEGAVVDVSLDSKRRHVVIDVQTPETVLLGEVEDRVGALGGRLDVDGTPDGGMAVRVEVACA